MMVILWGEQNQIINGVETLRLWNFVMTVIAILRYRFYRIDRTNILCEHAVAFPIDRSSRVKR
ncbi:hypothetical protein D3C86_1887170 [compost metagenome]